MALDIRLFRNIYILHLIDHVSRFSAAAIVKLKDKEGIIKNISKWSSICGPPSKYFSDNGGEFSNENNNERSEAYNITIKKTAAEAPFLNGLVERHNAVLEDILLKTCEDKIVSIKIALQWVINSKKIDKCSWFFTLSIGILF